MFSRDVQKALLFALQYELGLADGTANGNFGPTTQSRLKARPTLTVGTQDSTNTFVRLYQAALTFNGYGTAFDGTYSSDTAARTREFQEFTGLPVNGDGNYQTWASLLVSTGDPDRSVTALDTITRITSTMASNLYAAGYRTVGRYLTNVNSPNALNKKIQPGELATIFDAGMSVFPIYQTYGGEASYFNAAQGAADAIAAHDAAVGYGFPKGTRIYFAVDYDSWGDDIPVNILPHFAAIQRELVDKRSRYRLGIYAPRNVCTQVADNVSPDILSFVSGMSTGFSGNLGYPLPATWAFDQIATVTAHGLTFDKVVMSGRDLGASSVNTTPIVNLPLSQYIRQVANLTAGWAQENPDGPGSNYGTNLLTAQYASYLKYGGDGVEGAQWQILYGEIPSSWIEYVDSRDVLRVEDFTDPATFTTLDTEHLAATTWGYLSRGIPETELGRVNFADIGGWAGDFITTVGDWNLHGDNYPDAYTFARSVIGARVGGYTWGLGDLIEDVDGFGLAYNLKYEPTKFLPDVIDERYTNADPSIFNWATRFKSFYFGRFAENPANIESAAASLFVDEDPEIAVFVELLLTAKGYNPFFVLDRTVQDIARGFKDVILEWVQNENDRDYSS